MVRNKDSFMYSYLPPTIPTSQMCLHCRRKGEEKTRLLSSLRWLKSIYCSTQGCSQHSHALLWDVCRHTCLCARRILTGAGTTHTNFLHNVWLSECTRGGLTSSQRLLYDSLLCKPWMDMLKKKRKRTFARPNTWSAAGFKCQDCGSVVECYSVTVLSWHFILHYIFRER